MSKSAEFDGHIKVWREKGRVRVALSGGLIEDPIRLTAREDTEPGQALLHQLDLHTLVRLSDNGHVATYDTERGGFLIRRGSESLLVREKGESIELVVDGDLGLQVRDEAREASVMELLGEVCAILSELRWDERPLESASESLVAIMRLLMEFRHAGGALVDIGMPRFATVLPYMRPILVARPGTAEDVARVLDLISGTGMYLMLDLRAGSWDSSVIKATLDICAAASVECSVVWREGDRVFLQTSHDNYSARAQQSGASVCILSDLRFNGQAYSVRSAAVGSGLVSALNTLEKGLPEPVQYLLSEEDARDKVLRLLAQSADMSAEQIADAMVEQGLLA